MWSFVIFIRDRLVQIADVLDRYHFNIAGLDVSLFEMLIGIVAMGIVIAVFWKGART